MISIRVLKGSPENRSLVPPDVYGRGGNPEENDPIGDGCSRQLPIHG
jgi:hypothetical protein